MVAALYALSIPWYRQAGADTGTFLGLPSWAAVALLCYAGAAVANAGAWLLTDVPDAESPTGAPHAEEAIDVTAEEGP